MFKRTSRWVLYALGALIVLMGILEMMIGYRGVGAGIRSIAFGVFIASIYEIILRWYVFRQRHLLNQEVKAKFTDVGIEVRSQSWDSKLAWANFKKISRRGGFWIFALTPYQALLFPDHLLGDGGNEQLTAFLKEHRLLN